MKKHIISLTLLASCYVLSVYSQIDLPECNIQDYTELNDPKPGNNSEEWDKIVRKPVFAWGTIDERYGKHSIPQYSTSKVHKATAWKNERINAQAILFTNTNIDKAIIEVSDLSNGKYKIPASAVKASFVRYVMTDELNKDGKGGCGDRSDKSQWDSSLVADVLDVIKIKDIAAKTTQPVWINVHVPEDIPAGKYKGTISIKGENFSKQTLNIQLEVLNRTLPNPENWKYHLDLWQNPYSVARFHNVPLWSKEHFEKMKPVMKILADAGQKVITTSIMHKPWAGQTEDHFDSMITRIKKIDGNWEYNYAVFDKWVDFMMNEVGIDKQINCYTLIPWALTFDYYDEATNRVQFINAKPGDKAYNEYWGSFLKDFAKHLKEKGWFEKTTIAMDERGLDAMKEAIKVIKAADPNFKISLAGNYHEEIQADLYDLCLAYSHNFPEKIKAEREAKGKVSTVYTCCAEARPNTYTFSPTAEAVWIGWHAMAGNYDGYLRWAYNSWTKNPLLDSRFRTWAAGDCYLVYPDGRSSIRMERLIEGIQDFEKIRILKDEFSNKKQDKKLQLLNNTVDNFTPEGLAKTQDSMTEMVNKAKEVLNKLSR